MKIETIKAEKITTENIKYVLTAYEAMGKRVAGAIIEGKVFIWGDVVKTPDHFSVEFDTETLEFVRAYVGTPIHGIVAQWVNDGESSGWTPCWSRGNFGQNYTSGGNWSSSCRKCGTFESLTKAIDVKPFDDITANSEAEAKRNRSYIKTFLGLNS